MNRKIEAGANLVDADETEDARSDVVYLQHDPLKVQPVVNLRPIRCIRIFGADFKIEKRNIRSAWPKLVPICCIFIV